MNDRYTRVTAPAGFEQALYLDPDAYAYAITKFSRAALMKPECSPLERSSERLCLLDAVGKGRSPLLCTSKFLLWM